MGLLAHLRESWREDAELGRRGLKIFKNSRGGAYVFDVDVFDPPIGQMWRTAMGWFYVAWIGELKINEKPIGPYTSATEAALALYGQRSEALESKSFALTVPPIDGVVDTEVDPPTGGLTAESAVP